MTQNNIQKPPVAATAQSAPSTLLERLHRALGPLAGGIIIDCVDFAMFGPVALILGPVVGGLVGWWVSSLYHFGTRGRLIVATLSAIYCTIPIKLLPLATLVAACARFRESTGRPSLNSDERVDSEAAAEVSAAAGDPVRRHSDSPIR
ncbi:MAG: hypothetical protein EXS05_09780 [Planctomycetaceae bacterium]|nr:hypothetical protein [Planctomycetaceae bacterium]